MKIIEAPRDAMQGFKAFIPTHRKIEFINALLKIGFDTIDFGSFVSPKVIPQLRDTAEVLEGLDLSYTETKLLAIVANERGAEEACSHAPIRYVGFPFSVSESYARLNTNATMDELFVRAQRVKEIIEKAGKEMVLYIGTAFGNPYGDFWSVEIVAEWVAKFEDLGIKILHLADTTGEASPPTIELLFKNIASTFPEMEIGLHLHTHPHLYIEKVDAAFRSGCRRFDTVINGLGGCPTSEKELVGNLRTGSLISYVERQGIQLNLNRMAFLDAVKLSKKVFEPAFVR